MSSHCWEREELIERCLGNLALVDLLLQGFQGRIPVTVTEMQASLEASNIDQAKRLAHRLSGEAANLGATQICHAAKNMEAIAQGGQVDQLESALQSVIETCQIFQTHVATVTALPPHTR